MQLILSSTVPIIFYIYFTRVGLLIPHRAAPQVGDRGTLAGLPEGTGEIKYPGWTKIQRTEQWKQNIRIRLPQVADRVNTRKIHPLTRQAPWILGGRGGATIAY